MIENQYALKPGERFPKEMKAPEHADVLLELSKFGIGSANTIKLIDTTRDALDVRLNYIINKKWVLRFCNAPDMTEKRMGELKCLIERYRAIGFKCPAFIADDNGKYLHPMKRILSLFRSKAVFYSLLLKNRFFSDVFQVLYGGRNSIL